MSSTPLIVHGTFAAISFSAAAGSVLAAIRLGGLKFLQENCEYQRPLAGHESYSLHWTDLHITPCISLFVVPDVIVFRGLCVDVWDGFFLSPTNLLAIAFLTFLPIHCYQTRAPHLILCLTTIMAFPSFLFITATFLETSPVLLPMALAVGCFGKFGLSELELATHSKSGSRSSRSSSSSPRSRSSNASSPSLVQISCSDDELSSKNSIIKRKRSDSWKKNRHTLLLSVRSATSIGHQLIIDRRPSPTQAPNSCFVVWVVNIHILLSYYLVFCVAHSPSCSLSIKQQW